MCTFRGNGDEDHFLLERASGKRILTEATTNNRNPCYLQGWWWGGGSFFLFPFLASAHKIGISVSLKTQEVTASCSLNMCTGPLPVRSERCTQWVRWAESIICHYILFRVGPMQTRETLSACLVFQGAPKLSDLQKMRQTVTLHATRQTELLCRPNSCLCIPSLRFGRGASLGGPLVETPPCNAGEEGLIPSQGTKIPHALGQLSPCTPTEPTHHSERSHVT